MCIVQRIVLSTKNIGVSSCQCLICPLLATMRGCLSSAHMIFEVHSWWNSNINLGFQWSHPAKWNNNELRHTQVFSQSNKMEQFCVMTFTYPHYNHNLWITLCWRTWGKLSPSTLVLMYRVCCPCAAWTTTTALWSIQILNVVPEQNCVWSLFPCIWMPLRTQGGV